MSIIENDMENIGKKLGKKIENFSGKKILITGALGFLGYNFLNFFNYLNEKVSKPCNVVAIDSKIIDNLDRNLNLDEKYFKFLKIDISKPFSEEIGDEINDIDFVIHAASIASPTYYRKYPIETIDANVWGLRNLLEFFKNREINSFLFFSSSEIYGDPPPNAIPTKESYNGNVSCIGPRACYDESKRIGETLCYYFHKIYEIPIKIARPFNNYGPGMNLNDRRVIPDFCNFVINNKDIILYSDGNASRTFCYVSDAITGYLLLLLSKYNAIPFNIGTDRPEIKIIDLANLVVKISRKCFKYKGQIKMEKSTDIDYLKNNPNRRCPDITNANEKLGYNPEITLEDGLTKTLLWFKGVYS